MSASMKATLSRHSYARVFRSVRWCVVAHAACYAFTKITLASRHLFASGSQWQKSFDFYRRIQLSQETMKDGTAKFGCTMY